jgi:uncharacterized protein YbbC (DUF1343 family)
MYEFRDDVPAIDLLTGSPDIRIAIDAGKSLEEIWQISKHSLQKYESARPDVLIYE